MVAIAGLLVIGIPFIGRMGIGAAIGVAAVVVSALTFVPVMLGAFARRLKPKKPEHVAASPGFERWGRRIVARPWAAIAGGALLSAGALAERWTVFKAGSASAARPQDTIGPQRDRLSRV